MSVLPPRTVAWNSAAWSEQCAGLLAAAAGVELMKLTGHEVTIPLSAVARELTGRDDAEHRQAVEAT